MKEHVAEIVAAYVKRNAISLDRLPALIASVKDAVSSLGQSAAPETTPESPAVPIRRSVGDNFNYLPDVWVERPNAQTAPPIR